MDRAVVIYTFILLFNCYVSGDKFKFESYTYENQTDPATRQLYEFRKDHPKPIGLQTTSSGYPVDIRDTVTLNTDLFFNTLFVDSLLHLDSERIPEKPVHAKGTAALGYFELTNDVSMYTKADVFNDVGKITPIVGRFSSVAQNKGGTDLAREIKGLAIKFYTRDGNLDLTCLNFPVFFHNDPLYFTFLAHAIKRNPKTYLFDDTAKMDFFSLRGETLHAVLWLLSDYGIPNGYRKMNAFAIHTYEVNNKHGEKFFVKFNFRTMQGVENLPSNEAKRISGLDADYYNRDLYNAIATKHYPIWKLEMYVMSYSDVLKLDYNPFDVTVIWKKGTYRTVDVGKIVFTKNPDNMFRISEQVAFNPANLVPGIPGPYDYMFKSRKVSYRDAQKHRLGTNHNKIEVNYPIYEKVYNRNGRPPVRENMKDAPNYYPNSFSGPIPFVDETRSQRFSILHRNAADLEEASYFYNHVLYNNGQRLRLANNTAELLVANPPFIQKRVINLFGLIDLQLGADVRRFLYKALNNTNPVRPRIVIKLPRDKCV